MNVIPAVVFMATPLRRNPFICRRDGIVPLPTQPVAFKINSLLVNLPLRTGSVHH